ncbi:MAG: inositol 2-dehydrogenase [Gammaproteobacteria bacterium]|nr:inositol 2-dehydrogenase [Gammaproteobacteria bacterium]
MINLALFGAGRIGSIHGDNVQRHPDANLLALHDPFTDNANRLAQQLGCSQMTPQQIFESKSIDGVLICSATDTHADLIERAVEAGKHVFCEKPIDLSLRRVQQCVTQVSASELKIMVAFNRRFDPNFQTLQRQITAGEIGKIELVSIISKDPSPPPIDYINVSGGLFRDMTIHDFDMARFLLGEDIVSVSAMGTCLVDSAIGEAGDIDTASVLLSTTSGKLAQISNSRRASFGYDQRIEAHGSKGMLIAQNLNENAVVSYNQSGVHSAKPLRFFLERYEAAYRSELDAFVRSLNGENVEIPGMDDGLKALQLAEAALQSLQEGRNINPATLA